MTVQATFAATLAEEWARAGVRDVVVCPGSRSSPLALALLGEARLTVHVRLDERGAAFYALGRALASQRPVILVTTSGTASAEAHAAVVEADLAGVPLVVCTADRPPELHGVGAPQAIDQLHLYGGAVRYFVDPGVPDLATAWTWRSFASRLVAEAVAGPKGPGPVHANLAFREPLGGEPDALPAGRPDGGPWHEVRRASAAPAEVVAAVAERLAGRSRGVLLAGAGAGPAEPVYALAARLGWPVLAEPRAFPRTPAPGLVAHADALLRSGSARTHLLPEVLVQLGAPHASRVVGEWVAACAGAGTDLVLVDPAGAYRDPFRAASLIAAGDPSALCAALAVEVSPATDGAWLADWEAAEAAAAGAIMGCLADATLSEPGIARATFAALPAGTTLVVAASMPVRDLEWFAAVRPDAPRVLANRGANGIDGTISTLLGAAAGEKGPFVGLLGDLAFLHDLTGLLVGVDEPEPDATLVVVDNAGGGIFSFLDYTDAVEARRFERVFATGQRADLAAVATALGGRVREVRDLADLTEGLNAALRRPGLDVLLARTERAANRSLHRRLAEACGSAVDAALAARPG